MVKSIDCKTISRQERIVNQMKYFVHHFRMTQIEKGIFDTTIDDYSLPNFSELCSAIVCSSSLLHIEVQTKLDVGYLNELYRCLRDNRAVLSLKFSEPAYKPEIPFSIHKFFQRNSSLPKIVKFVIENFKKEDNDIEMSVIKFEDYSFLKYCLPSNQDKIEKGLVSANFTGTYNLNQLVHKQFAFNLVCKDITNGGLFAILPIEVHNLIFNSLEDHGVPCIGKQYIISDA